MIRNPFRHRSSFIALVLFVHVTFASIICLAEEQPETDPLKPAAIETTGVPKLAPEIVAQLAKYQNIRGAGFAGWSPDGKGILIRTRFANTVQLHRVYTPGGRREQWTFDKEPVRGEFIEHATDGAMLLTKSSGGNEQTQVFAFDPKLNKKTLLTDGLSRNGLGVTSPDGKLVIISSSMRNGRDTDMYVSDCRKGGTMELLLETKGEFWYAADWSQDGKRLLMGQYVSANESHLGLFDIATKKLTRYDLASKPTDGKAPTKAVYSPVGFTPDGAGFYFISDMLGEFSQLAKYTFENQSIEWLSKDIPWNVEDATIHDESGLLVFSVNENGASKLFAIENGVRRVIDLPLGIVNSMRLSPDGKHLGMSLSKPNGPTDVYSVELASGQLTRWTYSELGGLDASTFLLPQQMHFKSFDGREIPAYIYRPNDSSTKTPAPVIISIHGGPEGQTRPYFSSSAQLYAGQMGVAYIAPNVRGSSGYGKTFLKLDNGMKREDSVKDIGALLDWIAKQPDLDEKRVLVMGGSYGGYMTLASLTNFPNRLRGGIDSVGIANFISFLEKTKPYRQQLRRVEYGDERDPAMRAFFEKINPTANAHKIRSALMVVHGKNDPRVPFFEAQQIAQKAKKQGVPVWTVYAENEGHGFGKKENRDYLQAVQVMFVKKFLNLE